MEYGVFQKINNKNTVIRIIRIRIHSEEPLFDCSLTTVIQGLIRESGKHNMSYKIRRTKTEKKRKTIVTGVEEKQGKLILFVSLKGPLERQCGRGKQTQWKGY